MALDLHNAVWRPHPSTWAELDSWDQALQHAAGCHSKAASRAAAGSEGVGLGATEALPAHRLPCGALCSQVLPHASLRSRMEFGVNTNACETWSVAHASDPPSTRSGLRCSSAVLSCIPAFVENSFESWCGVLC